LYVSFNLNRDFIEDFGGFAHFVCLVRYILQVLSPYIIFDRDGTLIEHVHHLIDPNLVRLKPRLVIGLQLLKEHGFNFGIISNQSVINRGYATKEVVNQVNEKMQELLRSEGIEFKFIKYCPHRPEELCGCRKPAMGLGLQAIGEFKIDLNRSFMIGDMDSDVIFGHAIGLRSIQLITGEVKESSANFVASDISEAADWILNESRKEK